MSGREAPSTYRNKPGGTIHPETDNPALLALLRENSRAEQSSKTPQPSVPTSGPGSDPNADLNQRHPENTVPVSQSFAENTTVDQSHGQSFRSDPVSQHTSAPPPQPARHYGKDDVRKERQGGSEDTVLEEWQENPAAHVPTSPPPQPLPVARSISQTIIRDDPHQPGERSGHRSSVVSPISRFALSETDSASSELARLVGTPSRKSFVLSAAVSEADDDEADDEAEDTEGVGGDVDDSDDPSTGPHQSHDGNGGRADRENRDRDRAARQSSPPLPVSSAAAAVPAGGSAGLSSLAGGPGAPSPDLNNPGHHRFVTPYAARRLKDKPAGRASAVSFQLEEDRTTRTTLNVPKDQNWSANQAARLRAGADQPAEVASPDESGLPTPRAEDAELVDSLDYENEGLAPSHHPLPQSASRSQPASDATHETGPIVQGDNSARAPSIPPPLDAGSDNVTAPDLRTPPPAQVEQQPSSGSNSKPQLSHPSSGSTHPQSAVPGVGGSVPPSARGTPVSILKKPRGGNSVVQAVPTPVDTVYVESPTFTREEEEEYRFVSSRVENYEEEQVPGHPTFRGLDEQAVSRMDNRATVGGPNASRPVKQVRYQDVSGRYEDRDNAIPSRRSAAPPSGQQRQYVIKPKHGSAPTNSRGSQPVRSLRIPDSAYDPADEYDLLQETAYQDELRTRLDSIQRSTTDTLVPRLVLDADSEEFRDSLDNVPEDVELDSERINRHLHQPLPRGGRRPEWGNRPPPPPPPPPQWQGYGHSPRQGYNENGNLRLYGDGYGQGYADLHSEGAVDSHRQDYDEVQRQGHSDSYGQGYADPRRQRYTDPQRQGYADPRRQGYPDGQKQGYSDHQRQGYSDPQSQGYGDPQRQGYGDPQRQGYADPQRQGYADPQRQGYADPQRQGYADPQRQGNPGYPKPGHQDPQRQGYADPYGQGYGEPERQGYRDLRQAEVDRQGYADPRRQGYADPHRQGYADPHRQEYADPHRQGYADPQRRGPADPQRQGHAGPPPQQGYADPNRQGPPRPGRGRQMLGYGDFPGYGVQEGYGDGDPSGGDYFDPQEGSVQVTPRVRGAPYGGGVPQGQYSANPAQSDSARVEGGYGGRPRQAPPPHPHQGGVYAQETRPPPQGQHPYLSEITPRDQGQGSGWQVYTGPHDGYNIPETPHDVGGGQYQDGYTPGPAGREGGATDRYQDQSQNSTARESSLDEKPEYDYISNNKMDFGRTPKRSYKTLHAVKKEEEEKLNHIFIQPKVKGKSQKGSRNSSPARYPAIAENPKEEDGPGPEGLWAQRSATLARAKNAKANSGVKKKPGVINSAFSRNNSRMQRTDSTNTITNPPQPPPPPPAAQPVQPRASQPLPLVPAAQHHNQVSAGQSPPPRPLALQPISQQVVTEDGQRISVDVNLRLITPQLGSEGEGVSAQPVNAQRQTWQQRPTDVIPREQTYTADDDDYPLARHSADDALSSKNLYGDVVGDIDRLGGYVSDSNHDYALEGYTTNPYKKIPPIPSSSEGAPRSAPQLSEGSYMQTYLREKEKTQNVKKPSYRVYGLKDYKRMVKEVRLGTLGPDLESDVYRERRERAQRQLEYAKAVKDKNARELLTRKPPAFPRPKDPDDSLSKRKMAVDYAKTVPKPTVKPQPNPYNNYQLASELSPIAKPPQPTSSPQEASVEVLDLQKLHERHEQDKRSADMIRQKAQSVLS